MDSIQFLAAMTRMDFTELTIFFFITLNLKLIPESGSAAVHVVRTKGEGRNLKIPKLFSLCLVLDHVAHFQHFVPAYFGQNAFYRIKYLALFHNLLNLLLPKN